MSRICSHHLSPCVCFTFCAQTGEKSALSHLGSALKHDGLVRVALGSAFPRMVYIGSSVSWLIFLILLLSLCLNLRFSLSPAPPFPLISVDMHARVHHTHTHTTPAYTTHTHTHPLSLTHTHKHTHIHNRGFWLDHLNVAGLGLIRCAYRSLV